MATFLVWLTTAIVVAAAIFAVAASVGGQADLMAEMPPDSVPRGLPDAGPVQAADVAGVRFDRALRGYRMDQVDAVLDRLIAELAARDAVTQAAGAAPATSPLSLEVESTSASRSDLPDRSPEPPDVV